MTDTKTRAKYRLEVFYDERWDHEDETYVVKSFSTRHTNFQHPDTIDDDDVLGVLSYSEHGRCAWTLRAEGRPLGVDHWDHVSTAGVIVKGPAWDESMDKWWADKTAEDRRDTLRSVAEEYTAWCNGDIFGYSLIELSYCDHGGAHEGEPIDGCGGYYGMEYAEKEIKSEVEAHGIAWEDIEIVGDADWLVK